MPRSDYPEGKAGYYKWRTGLYQFHGEVAEETLKEVGYDDDVISVVKKLFLKKDIKTDKDSQILEDVICLVFLEYYFDDFIKKHDDDKIIDIVQKTWGKMSDKGHELALTINFPDKAGELVKRALS